MSATIAFQPVTDSSRFDNKDRQTGIVEWGMAAGRIELPVTEDGAVAIIATVYAHVNTATGGTRWSVSMPALKRTAGVIAMSRGMRDMLQKQANDYIIADGAEAASAALKATIARMVAPAPKPVATTATADKPAVEAFTLPSVAIATLKAANGETVAETVTTAEPVASTTTADGHDKGNVAPLTGAGVTPTGKATGKAKG